jgi:hypothetical protein
MKKPKFSFGEQGFKGFLAAHVEKIVLGFVMLLVLYFLYSGYSLEGYNAIRTPRQLKSQTEETRQFVLTDTALNRINGDEKRAIIRDHKERAEKSRNATSGADYPVGTAQFRQQESPRRCETPGGGVGRSAFLPGCHAAKQ